MSAGAGDVVIVVTVCQFDRAPSCGRRRNDSRQSVSGVRPVVRDVHLVPFGGDAVDDVGGIAAEGYEVDVANHRSDA